MKCGAESVKRLVTFKFWKNTECDKERSQNWLINMDLVFDLFTVILFLALPYLLFAIEIKGLKAMKCGYREQYPLHVLYVDIKITEPFSI